MITPEGSGGSDRPGVKARGPIWIAVLVVLGGLVAVGVLSSPDPTPTAPTSTTTTTNGEIDRPIDTDDFTIGQISTGEPLDWGLSMAIDDLDPRALFEHDDALYLFASGPDETGLFAWRSENGLDWSALDATIPEEFRVSAIEETPQGIVAAGIRLEDNALVVWESDDANDWDSSVVRDAAGYFLDYPTAVGGSSDTLAVASNVRFDRERLLEERLLAAGIEIDLSVLTWNLQWLGETGHHLIARGPLGIPVLDHPIDDLDLTEDERNELLSELTEPLGTDIWLRDGTAWRQTSITDARQIDSIYSTAADRFVALGRGASGRVARSSTPGRGWGHAESAISPEQVEQWNDRFVGVVPGPDLAMSDEGDLWRAAGLADRFPDEFHWSTTALGAGDGGVAMFIRGDRALFTLPTPEPRELAGPNGGTFLLEFHGGRFELRSEGDSMEWGLNIDGTPQVEDAIVVDPKSRTLTFNDPATGEEVVVFTFSEIERAQWEHSESLLPYEHLGALAFSPDGEDWAVHDMSSEIGEDASVWLLEVTDERAVAVVQDTFEGLTGRGLPGFEVWSAQIP